MKKEVENTRSVTFTKELKNGVEIPYLGFGTYRIQGEAAYQAVLEALRVGYRHIDTAAIYRNESQIGQAIKDSGIPREEIFVATKLWNDDQGFDKTLRAFEKSLSQLQSSYVDLYLIHWPVPEKRLQSWRALQEIYVQQKARAIGLSNFLIRHLKELRSSSDVLPAVNQIELHPFLYDKELIDYCESSEIAVEAYSPLTKGRRLSDSRVTAIAQKYEKTPAQLLIRWCLEHDWIVLPKSRHPQRIHENADVFDFEISAEDMQILDSLNENLHTGWDPTDVS
jgi:diketogulonate reductase-like aldo/keto reductase